MRPLAMRRLSAVFLLAAVLAGCAPIYEPGYRLELPAGDAEVASCAADCAAVEGACLTPADNQFAACQDRAVLEQNLCRGKAQVEFQVCQSADARDGRTCFYRICEMRQCGRGAIEACEASYRSCFAGCGGTVVEEQRCVANCPS